MRSIVVIAIVLCCGFAVSLAQEPAKSRTKWEYKVLSEISETELNKLGDDGWEVAGVASRIVGDDKKTVTSFKIILKRQK